MQNQQYERQPLRNFYFIWKNPRRTDILKDTKMHCVYRIFNNQLYQEHIDLPEKLRQYQRVIPSPQIFPFTQTNQIKIDKQQDGSQNEEVWFSFSCYLQPNQILQVCYTYSYSLSNIYGDMLLTPRIQYRNLGLTPQYKLPVYQFTYAPIKTNSKKCIILSARIHPGESLQSFVLMEIINQLAILQTLEDIWIYVVPCLNPDGVFQGNQRLDCYKNNLNRKYDQIQQNQETLASIKYFVDFVKDLLNNQMQILQVIDLHCHTIKKSFLLFGNDLLAHELQKLDIDKEKFEQYLKQQEKENTNIMQGLVQRSKTPAYQFKNILQHRQKLKQKQKDQFKNLSFLFLLYEKSLQITGGQQLLSLDLSDFSEKNMTPDKTQDPMSGSQRYFLLQRFGLQNVYTIEINYGINIPEQQNEQQYRIVDLQFLIQLGRIISQSIYEFCHASNDQLIHYCKNQFEQSKNQRFATQYLLDDI